MPSHTTFAPSSVSHFHSANVNFAGRGVLAVAATGTVSNIDMVLVDDSFLTGCVFNTKGAVFGDYVNLQVVDVDNIFGMGAGAVLNQFATNWYLCDDTTTGQAQILIEVPYPAKIYAGLWLRIEYHSVGTADVQVSMNYLLHKALY